MRGAGGRPCARVRTARWRRPRAFRPCCRCVARRPGRRAAEERDHMAEHGYRDGMAVAGAGLALLAALSPTPAVAAQRNAQAHRHRHRYRHRIQHGRRITLRTGSLPQDAPADRSAGHRPVRIPGASGARSPASRTVADARYEPGPCPRTAGPIPEREGAAAEGSPCPRTVPYRAAERSAPAARLFRRSPPTRSLSRAQTRTRGSPAGPATMRSERRRGWWAAA